jgi:5-oxopent-3-ene-1,2,5-tricarboxylate decarboxylase / 2-hydroxyhepta-2,4-diene-1,7-dioate isomerase
MSFLSMGTVYGTLMNFRGEWDALGEAMNQPPYQAPPKAPVLYIKPANTWTHAGEPIVLPSDVAEVEVGASVAMVMKAPGEIAGYVLMCDLTVPQESFYRPPVKARCRDGFLGVGNTLLPAAGCPDPSGIEIQVMVNGSLRQTVRLADLVRPAPRLLAEVSEFMTLGAGDVLMLGCDAARPRVRALDRIDISAPGLGTLSHILAPEGTP